MKLHLARLLRRIAVGLQGAASELDPEVRPLKIEWRDGRRLILPPGWTLEQAMDLVARLREFDTP